MAMERSVTSDDDTLLTSVCLLNEGQQHIHPEVNVCRQWGLFSNLGGAPPGRNM